MKKALFILMAVAISTASFAQKSKQSSAKGKPEKLTTQQIAQKYVEKLNGIVGLTKDQQVKALALATERAEKVKSIREAYKGKDQKETAKAEIKNSRKDYRQRIKGLLTPEQLEKLKAYQKQQGKDKGKSDEDPTNAVPDVD